MRPVLKDILVVEDEADVRELIADYFRSRSHVVATAADGRAAATAIEREPGRFGLVLCDQNIPGMNGLEVLERVRQINPSTAVVIMTGYASLDSAIQAVRLGAYDYLTKPFALGQLEILLKRVVDRVALETENRQLARLVDAARGNDGGELLVRLASIDRRLERLESLIGEFAPKF